ncbi:MAG: hypothetical protein AABX99_02110 [Nanoarchaeota archaeon]
MQKFLKILKWTGIVLVILFIVAEIIRWPFRVREERTAELVQKIHATKLQLSDVMGDNLPPDPGAEADKTIAGIDANKNGIRDDVELVIFKEYPNSAKTRAVLLQYALTLQLQMTLPITNKDTVTATVEDNESRADICLWNLSSRKDMKKFSADIDKYENFIKNLQLNTETRKNYLGNLFEGNLSSYSSSNDGCDLDLKTLPN